MSRIPPHSAEAEMSVLGCAVLNADACDVMLESCREEDFYREVHRTLYRVLATLRKRGVAPDLVSIPARLQETGELASFGGLEYLLQVCETVPSVHNVRYYAQMVADLSTLRQLAEAHEKGLELVFDADKEPGDKVDESLAMLREIRVPFRLPSHISEIDAAKPVKGVPTGLAGIDKLTECGGLACGQMGVAMAGPKVGKTSVLVQFASHAAYRGESVLYVTLGDLDRVGIKRRICKQLTGFAEPPDDLFDEWRDKVAVVDSLWDMRVWDTKSGASRFVEDTVRGIGAMHDERPIGLVCVDYAQLMHSRHEKDRVRELERVSQSLAELADACGFPLWVGSQTNEQGKTRYSQEFLMDCGLAVEFVRPEEYGTKVEANVRYNRFGPAGSFEAEFDTKRLAVVQGG